MLKSSGKNVGQAGISHAFFGFFFVIGENADILEAAQIVPGVRADKSGRATVRVAQEFLGEGYDVACGGCAR